MDLQKKLQSQKEKIDESRYTYFDIKTNGKIEEIGQMIKSIRIQNKWTQERLAEYADLSPHYIYEVERGSKTISLDVLFRLSDVFRVSPGYILGDVSKEEDDKRAAYGSLNDYEINLIETLRSSTRMGPYVDKEEEWINDIITFINILRKHQHQKID